MTLVDRSRARACARRAIGCAIGLAVALAARPAAAQEPFNLTAPVKSLATMFTAAGLIEVSASVEDEIACLGDAGFEDALAIWQQAIRTMASPMIETGAIDADGADAAAAAWEDWRRVARRQHMVMRAVVGRRGDGGHR